MTLVNYYLVIGSLLGRCSFQNFSFLSSKKVKLSGLVMEDKRTGDRYVAQVSVMEEMIGPKQTEPEQTDSQSTPQGMERFHDCTSMLPFVLVEMCETTFSSCRSWKHALFFRTTAYLQQCLCSVMLCLIKWKRKGSFDHANRKKKARFSIANKV